jgi:hypothetical protein
VIDSALDKILKLRGVEFNWIKFENGVEIDELGRRDIGVIAQEVNEYFSELVKVDSRGFLSVHYDQLLPIIVESIQIQNLVLTQSEEKLGSLEIQLKEKGLI